MGLAVRSWRRGAHEVPRHRGPRVSSRGSPLLSLTRNCCLDFTIFQNLMETSLCPHHPLTSMATRQLSAPFPRRQGLKPACSAGTAAWVVIVMHTTRRGAQGGEGELRGYSCSYSLCVRGVGVRCLGGCPREGVLGEGRGQILCSWPKIVLKTLWRIAGGKPNATK